MIPLIGASRLSFGKMRNMVQIVYTGLLGSLVALSTIAYLMMDRIDTSDSLPSTLLLFTGALVSIVAVAICTALPKFLVHHVTKDDVALRLRGFVHAKILFAAGFEGAGLFWALLALLLKQPLCLAGSAEALHRRPVCLIKRSFKNEWDRKVF